MKKLFVLFFLPLLAFTVTGDWTTVSISPGVSVDFPSDPIQKESGGNPVWVAMDSNSYCVAMVIDFEKMGVDSAQVAAELHGQQFYDDFKSSYMGQLPGATLASEKKIRVKGHLAFDFLVNLADKADSPYNRVHSRTIFLGTKAYSLSFFESDTKPDPEGLSKFFGSFTLN